MKKKALIIGISGQDGTYLADYLLKKNYNVFGVSRSTTKKKNFKVLKIKKKIHIYKSNLIKFDEVKKIIKLSDCEEVYFLGGQTFPSKSTQLSFETIYSNTIPIFNILETIRISKKRIKLFNASSSEIFGNTKSKLFEDSKKDPINIYGLSKLISFRIVEFYRKNYNLFACSTINFHHESILRKNDFVIKKIINGARNIQSKKKKNLYLGNIRVIKDWGWAPEYVSLFYKILKRKKPEDFILATGKSVKLQYVIKKVFGHFNLNWKKHVKIDKNLVRKKDFHSTYANPAKIKKKLKWKTQNYIEDILIKLIKGKLY